MNVNIEKDGVLDFSECTTRNGLDYFIAFCKALRESPLIKAELDKIPEGHPIFEGKKFFDTPRLSRYMENVEYDLMAADIEQDAETLIWCEKTIATLAEHGIHFKKIDQAHYFDLGEFYI